MELTEDQKKICALTGVSPAKLTARMAAQNPDGTNDDDGDTPDEIQAAQNHLECCRDEGEDTMSRVSMARDCLNDFLAKSGAAVKNSSGAHEVAFPQHPGSR